MYTSLLLLVAVLVPIPLIIKGITKKEEPYKVCIEGIIGAGIAMVFLFILAAQGGHGIGEELALAGQEIVKMLPAEQGDAFRTLYDRAMAGISGTMLVFTAICSYAEYVLFSRIIKIGGEPALRMPPIRELHLPRSAIRGWVVVIVLSWLVKLSGLGAGNVVMINVNILFEFTFALQGISLFFLWAHLRQFPKALPVIAIIFLWLFPGGMTLLFIAGILDLFVGLRRRILPKQ